MSKFSKLIPNVLTSTLVCFGLSITPAKAQEAAAVTYSLEAGVVYGQGVVTKEGKAVSRDLWMDIYFPTKKTVSPRPAVILTFGGAFHRGSPRLTFQSGGAQDTSMGNYCRRFAARGYACFAIEYRLTPEGPVPSGEGYKSDWINPDSLLPLLPQANHIRETMDLPPLDFTITAQEKTMVDGVISAAEDLRKAVLHIRENADRYDIDPDRIALGGFSAGAVTSWNVAHGMGVPVSGVFLLSGSDAGFDVTKAVTASSERPPILMFMGQYDLAGALSSIPSLIDHYKEVGVDHEFAWVPGFGHFYPAGAASLGNDAVSMSVEGRIVEFLEDVIGKAQ
jgi:predicted esterase